MLKLRTHRSCRSLTSTDFRLSLALAILFLVAAASHASAAADAGSLLDGFDEQVEGWMKEWKVPGLGVAIVKDGEVVLARGYGYRNLEDRVPADENTLFAIGSNSKSFTVTLLGALAEEGKVDWDTPIQQYLPDFRMHDPFATAEMTARDLVTHRSGLPRHDLTWYATGRSRDELFELLEHLEPTKPFRSTYQYQNLMFMTAGYLAERLTNRSWEELVNEKLFDPIGMERSNFSVDAMQKDANFSYAYSHRPEQEIERIPFRNIDAIGPAGSINSSAAEMAKYIQFHLDYGRVGDKQVISENTARQMQSPQMPITGPQLAALFSGADEGVFGDPSYGMGLMVSSYRGHKHVSHGGGIDGFISAMNWLPHDDIGIVVLSNTNGSGVVPTLVVRNAFDRLLGLEPIDFAATQREREAKAKTDSDEKKAKDDADRKKDTRPSHALFDYSGTYAHPAYGAATVTSRDDQLQIAVVGFEVPLEHYHYDVFEVPEGLEGDAASLEGTKVQFLYDKRGTVDRVTVPLEPNLPDMIFERQPNEEMSDPDFLAKFVGTYELEGQTGEIALRTDNTLTLSLPGQPTWTLSPEQGTSFTIDTLPGFHVEFGLEEGAEHAETVTFIQPNGTFVATRKQP